MTDPIADMLTRIRNASAVGKTHVFIPYSGLKLAILKSLIQAGYIIGLEEITESGLKEIRVELKYIHKQPAITRIERISTPGRRVYTTKKKIKPVLSGQGTLIISTNKGVMTSKEAQISNVGGEVICRVW